MTMSTQVATVEIALALGRLASAHERIAAVLEDEAKIGGALDAFRGISLAIQGLAAEVGGLPIQNPVRK